MSTTQINILNIFLMILALSAALVFPVELFVLSYAILGPLHYLTEVVWLDKRAYFLPRKKQSYVFFALSLVTSATLLLPRYYAPELPLLALILAAVFIFGQKKNFLFLSASVSAVGLAYAFEIGQIRNIVLLLPTLIHVSCFTLIFIFVGALRAKSVSAYLSLGTYCLCLALIFLLSSVVPHGLASEAMQAANQVIAPYITLPLMKLFHIQTTEIGMLQCQRVIAFSYSYHYLNWFSKTRVIQWHKIPRFQLAIVLSIYALNLGFYYQSFYLGFLVSYLLSIGHVYLEFPLNIRSITEALNKYVPMKGAES